MVHKVTDKVEEEQSEQTFLLFLLPHSVEKSKICFHLKNISRNQCSVSSSINEELISRNFWKKRWKWNVIISTLWLSLTLILRHNDAKVLITHYFWISDIY